MKVLHVFTLSTTARSFFDGQFRYLSDHGHDLHMISSDPEDTDFCRRNRLAAYHRSEVARRIDIRADIRAIADIRRYIRRNGINAVVGHTPKGAMVAMIAAWLARVPVRIYYRHGLIYTTATCGVQYSKTSNALPPHWPHVSSTSAPRFQPWR